MMSPFRRHGGPRGHGHGHHPHDDRFGPDADWQGPGAGRGRRERVFQGGDLKLLLLHLLREPAHGYDLMRAIGDLVGGDYSPSPGTVYPTLALLEDLGLAASTQEDGGRRRFRITAEGEAHLDQQRDALAQLLERLQHVNARSRARRMPEIVRAMENLKTSLRLRFADGTVDDETTRRIADVIDRAAVEIGRIRPGTPTGEASA